MAEPRPAWVEVDLEAVAHNVGVLRSAVSPAAEICAVVKANAYGHGDIEVAEAALEAGATRLGVILVDEALRLRAAGIAAPILLLHEPPAGRADQVVGNDLTACVFTPGTIDALGAAAERAGKDVKVHLKVDTGLNRLGVLPAALNEITVLLAKEPRIEVEGIFTHFAFADQPAHDFIDEQLRRFHAAVTTVRAAGLDVPVRHVANSAASLTRRDAHLEMVRPGVALYGLSPGPAVKEAEALRPALSLRARVAMVKRVPAGEAVSYGHRFRLERDSTIATIPLGYADGWPRLLGGNAEVLIAGRRYPAVGTVCMDSFMADLGDDTCDVGDEVTLIGVQGSERITADDVAERSQTINYEVVTRLSARLPRVAAG